MLSLLSARSALRLACGTLSRPAAASPFSRVTVFPSFRTFLTTTTVREPAAKAKSTTKSASPTKSKTKRTTAKATRATATKKSSTKVNKTTSATKRVKKTKPKEKKVKKFDRKLMTPPKHHGRSAYVVFLRQFMKDRKQQDKDIDVKVLLKQAVQEWQSMSETQKQTYAEPVQANKEDWERRYEAWYRALPSGYLRQINLKRKEKGKVVLRRPKGMRGPARAGYIYFYRDYRQTTAAANMTMAETASSAGKAWNALSQAERGKYNERAREAVAEFQKSQSA
ncbi:hypothetical protein GYMLUDRAFT_263189 [Collybiopsis luxurians FD-317 M1]|uniref:HMG box domain-containing protein n=1 Tax=Collybiopsis luxurians FD-317 M1 TaxID=944289 RepID=A0A0D0B2R8_9AGAR|nr:hypothetical protein GYMLUDRAFT_263189 [Collybiopsis luxurians FD-317 M1]